MEISIITPIYKGSKYVGNLLKMAEKNFEKLSEQFPNADIEYIFVNDYPEEELKIAKNQSELFDIKVLVNEVNSGIHQSRVNGLKVANGKYILFLDQDDEIADITLLDQYQKIGDHDIVVSNGYRKFADKAIPLYSRNMSLRLTGCETMYIFGTDLILSPGQCLIKKSAIPTRWQEQIMKVNGCDDLFLWLLMFNEKCKFKSNPSKLYSHLEEVGNFSASSQNMTKSYMDMCDMLAREKMIPDSKIRTLRRRYSLKNDLKKSKSKLAKILKIIANPDIVFFTALYKLGGFY